MHKLADISVLEGLQQSANESMGCGHLDVFNAHNEAIRNMSPPLFPTKTVQGYNFFVRGMEGLHAHVHVEKGNKKAKFWLTPNVSVKDKGNMKPHELNEAAKHIEFNKNTFIEQYRKHYPLPDKQ